MKYALVNGERQEAMPGVAATCLCCGTGVLAKCGEVRAPHWAHQSNRKCDVWSEGETEWHRNWKNYFPQAWQEIIHQDSSGERHIADVKTSWNWVLEFQHSYISPDERRSREMFYSKLVWIVDGNRRSRDKKRFMEVIGSPDPKSCLDDSPVISTFPEGALLRDWIQSNSHVFFDFGEESLYWLLPGSNDYWALIIQLSRQAFIELHGPDSRDRFDEEAKRYGIVAPKISSPATEALKRAPKDPLDTLLTLHEARYRNRT